MSYQEKKRLKTSPMQSPSPSPVSTPSQRSPSPSTSPTRPALIDDTNTNLTEKLNTQVESIINKLSVMEENLTKRISSIENNIADGVLKLVKDTVTVLEEHSNDITCLKLEMVKTKAELNTPKNIVSATHTSTELEKLKLELEQLNISSLATDAILLGVPFFPDENLKKMFHSLCQKLDYPPPAVCRIFRVKPKDNSVIIIKFVNAREKRNLLRAFIDHRKANTEKISLKDLGLDAKGVIYLHESLTKQNHTLYRQAIRLKRKRAFAAVFTTRGHVYIRLNKIDPAIRIDSFEKLNEFAKRSGIEDDSDEEED